MTLPRVRELRQLKRRELQALAKTHSIKANLRTEALIDALAQLAVIAPLQPVENSASGEPAPSGTQSEVALKERAIPRDASKCNGPGQEEDALRSQVDSLVKTVATLQSELKASALALADLREELQCHQRSQLTADAIRDLVRAEVEKQSERLAKDLAVGYERVEDRLDEHIEDFDTAQREQAQRLDRLETGTTGFASLIGSLEDRIGALQRSGSVGALTDTVTSIEDDAPPTQTLISFSSPAVSHIGDTDSACRLAAPVRKETPATPGQLALPVHMLALSSASRRTPRAALAAAQPASPVALPARASLGKHARSSDASEISVAAGEQVEAQASTLQHTPDASRSGFYTAPSTVTRPTTAQRDIHTRKRLRTSTGTSTWTTSQVALGDESLAIHDDDDGEDEDDNEDSRSREYTVRTKTGSSPAVIMTRDPSFFASRPASPSSRPAAVMSRSRASSITDRAGASADRNTTNEAAAASGGRKSMPMSGLPFPLVSPYRNSGRPSAHTSSVLPAASTTPRATKTGFGNFFSGLDSANKTDAGRRVSMFSSNKATLPASARKGPPPPTPPAHRTLFGTEFTGHRFGDAGTDVDDDAENDSDSLRWGAFAA